MVFADEEEQEKRLRTTNLAKRRAGKSLLGVAAEWDVLVESGQKPIHQTKAREAIIDDLSVFYNLDHLPVSPGRPSVADSPNQNFKV